MVDDETYIQELYAEVLPLAGHQVVDQAFNGREAVDMYAKLAPPPDVVIMDVRMPIMDGLEASRQILHKHPRARIVLISADATVKNRAHEVAVLGFLQKPFSVEALLRVLAGPAAVDPAPRKTP